MRRVIDLCLDLPPSPSETVETLRGYLFDEGMAQAKRLYAPMLLGKIGLSLDDVEAEAAASGNDRALGRVRDAAENASVSVDDFVASLDEIGVKWGITSAGYLSNEKTADVVNTYPDTFKGFITVDPTDRMQAVRDLEFAVTELGLHALYITPFRYGAPASDKLFYSLYTKACELGIAVHFHCSLSANPSVPYDLAHPRHIDQVAMDFPEMRMMASVAGFPWVLDFLMLAVRHSNVYLNLETHAPEKLSAHGAGFESYLYYGENVLQDRICFASNWTALGVGLDEQISQLERLPFSNRTKEKILYENAARFWNEV
ncbi:amidohydrolase family protein [Microbacterium sp. AGC85]